MKGKNDMHELIRIEAYLLSEKAGHPSHMHDYFWTQAEAIVRQRAAVVDVAVKAAGKKLVKAKGKAESKDADTGKKSAKSTKKTSAAPPPKADSPTAKTVGAKTGKASGKSK